MRGYVVGVYVAGPEEGSSVKDYRISAIVDAAQDLDEAMEICLRAADSLDEQVTGFWTALIRKEN